LQVFLHKPMYIGFNICSLQFFDAKPSKSEESFFFLRDRFTCSVVFHEKEIDIFFYNWTSFFVCRYETIINLGHKFYNLKILDSQTGFFGYFTNGGIFGCFGVFHMTLRYDEFTFSFGIFPFEKEYFNLAFLLSINDSTGAFLENSIHAQEGGKELKSRVL